MPTPLIVERWVSSDNKEEIHLFIPGECNTFVLGFNPDLVDEAQVVALLGVMGMEMPAY